MLFESWFEWFISFFLSLSLSKFSTNNICLSRKEALAYSIDKIITEPSRATLIG